MAGRWLSRRALCPPAQQHKRRFKVTTDSNHDLPIAPNLLDRQVDLAGPNRIWAGDITYRRLARPRLAWASPQALGSPSADSTTQLATRPKWD